MCQTFGGKVPQGRESCIFLVRRIILKTKQNFLSNMFFFIFLWLRAEKNLIFDEHFSALLSKNCVFRLQSTAPTWSFFRSLSSFSNHFELWELNFHTQSEKCSAQLSKLHFRWTDDNLMSSWISAEKCNCFFTTLGPSAKIVPDFCTKKFRYGYQNSNCTNTEGHSGGEHSLRSKQHLSNHFRN